MIMCVYIHIYTYIYIYIYIYIYTHTHDEKAEKYPEGQGTWKIPTKSNKRGGDRKSTWKRISNNENKNYPISWKQNRVIDK